MIELYPPGEFWSAHAEEERAEEEEETAVGE